MSATPPVCVPGSLRRVPEGLLRLRLIEQIALEVRHLRVGDELLGDILGPELGGCAEERVLGAFGIGRDDDQAAPGGKAVACRRRLESDAGRADVVREELAELVVPNAPDERGLATERRDADHRVGGRAARDLDAGPHRRVEVAGARGVDEGHAALHEPVLVEERIGLVAEHVDEGVPDADDVEARRAGSRRVHREPVIPR